MKTRIYTDKELEILNKNVFIKEVKYKREISYHPIFKLWCIMMKYDNPGLSAREIFERAGFDTSILSEKLPRCRIRQWKALYEKFGVNYFLTDSSSYSTIEKVKTNKETDKLFFLELEKFILRRLREIENDR